VYNAESKFLLYRYKDFWLRNEEEEEEGEEEEGVKRDGKEEQSEG